MLRPAMTDHGVRKPKAIFGYFLCIHMYTGSELPGIGIVQSSIFVYLNCAADR
jgi:hypothetical protein